jgi:hypothetical protein
MATGPIDPNLNAISTRQYSVADFAQRTQQAANSSQNVPQVNTAQNPEIAPTAVSPSATVNAQGQTIGTTISTTA